MAEREQNLDSLRLRQEKTRDALTKAAKTVRILGTGEIASWLDLTTADDFSDLQRRSGKVEEINSRLIQRAVPTLQSSLKEVSDQIAGFDTKLEEARLNVESVRQKVEKGLLPPVALETAHRMLSEMDGTTPQEKLASAVAKRKDVGEGEQLPKIVIDLENYEYISPASGLTVTPNYGYFRVLKHLAERPRNWIPVRNLSKFLRSKISVSTAINSLRYWIEKDPNESRILVAEGQSKGIKYMLRAEVEFVGENKKSERLREAHEVQNIPLPDSQVVEVTGKLISNLIAKLAQTSKTNSLTIDALADEFYGGYGTRTSSLVSGDIGRARQILKPYGWDVLQKVTREERARGKKAQYYLVKVGESEKKVVQTEPQEKPGPADSRKLAALNLFIDNPDASFEQILGIFGEKDKRGRPLKRHHLIWGLTGHVNRLAFRSYTFRDSFTPEEEKTLENVTKFLGRFDVKYPAKDLERFRKLAAQRLSLKPTREIIEKVKPEEILTDEEVLILVHILNYRRDYLEKFDIAAFPEENAINLMMVLTKRINGSVTVTDERLEEVRKSAIEKMRNFARNYDDNLANAQSSEIQELLLYFMDKDAEGVANLLQELLTAPIVIGVEYDSRRLLVRRTWKEIVLGDDFARKARQRSEAERPKVEPQVTKIKETPVVSKEKKVSPIEKRDPKLVNRVKTILKEIKKAGFALDGRANGAQILSVWNITTSEVNKRGKGLIRSARSGRSAKVSYEIADVAMILYLRSYDNNLSKNLKKDLRRLISRTISEKN